jgi:hypothetical protein
MDKAYYLYDQAIDIAREFDDKGCIIFYLIAKSSLLFSINRLKEAEMINQEATIVARELNLKEHIFSTELMDYQLKNNAEAMVNLLKDNDLTDIQKARIYFSLWKMTGQTDYQEKAKDIYHKLYQELPIYDYKMQLKELTGG